MKSVYRPICVLKTKLLTSVSVALSVACMVLGGNVASAQATITGIYPNGTNMFQPSPTLTFNANSPVGVTNVTVGLTVSSLYTGQSFLKNLTAANGLTITGPTTSLSVSAVLTSNTLYSAVIQIKDSNGNVASQTVTFDTLTPIYTWEAEDWDYNGGQFIDNPQTNAYATLGTGGGDAQNFNGGAAYRPINPGLSTESNGDQPRLPWIGTGKTDFDVGFTDGTDFGQYTRHYPAGTYNLFARASGGNGVRTESADITVVSGSAVISSAGSAPYKFGVQGRGWQSYDFMPVTDNAGNLVQITFDTNTSTLNVLQNQASDNMNFFMLMPLNTNVSVSTVSITNLYPDGAFQFQATNKLSFSASSSVSINPDDVIVNLTGTNLFGQGSVVSLSTANGLVITGSSTNINVIAPLGSNTVYQALIQVNDANGVPASKTVSFDTIAPVYTFEAEDFNYGGGSYFDNPQTNAYINLDGVADIDFHNNNTGNSGNAGYNRLGMPGEGAGDVARATHVGLPDYDLGNTVGGNWGNYTRHYPAGIYNIFVRVARGDGGNVTDAGKMSLVTGDITASGQTIQDLGKHNTPSTGNWQKYIWVPVINSGGSPARFVADGSVRTLRYTFDGAGENVGFFLLLPADLSVNPPPFVNGFQPDDSSLFQLTNKLTFIVNSSVGIATNNVLLNLNGANVSGLTFSGSSSAWNVSYPVKTNGLYTAIITLTDSAGTSVITNTFNTFSANNYQWEAEDYNHDSGQFFDNQIDAYNGFGSTPDVDNHQSDLNGSPFLYRLNSPSPSTQTGDVGGEKPRALFTSGGGAGIDYCIGFFGNSSWVNYTRHYPAGTYYVMGRFAEGNNPTEDTLSWVTGDVSTTNQTVSLLGTFPIAVHGWSSWAWSPLIDGGGNQVKITLDGSPATLRLGGTPVAGHDEANVGFLMLVPTSPDVKLIASIGGGNITIAFATQNGSAYQVQYKDKLTDANWIPLGSPISGNGAVQSVSDSTAGTGRFYRVQIQ